MRRRSSVIPIQRSSSPSPPQVGQGREGLVVREPPSSWTSASSMPDPWQSGQVSLRWTVGSGMHRLYLSGGCGPRSGERAPRGGRRDGPERGFVLRLVAGWANGAQRKCFSGPKPSSRSRTGSPIPRLASRWNSYRFSSKALAPLLPQPGGFAALRGDGA